MQKENIYKTLFLSTFKLSLFTFGGGYVIVPLMRKKFVEELKWIKEEEMLDMIAIAQSSPGAMAVNTSIILGYRLKGIAGALFTLLGTVSPPLIIITIVSVFYEWFKQNAIVNLMLKGMQAGISAVIISVVFSMAIEIIKGKRYIFILLMALVFIGSVIFDINIILMILLSAFVGLVDTFIQDIKKSKNIKGGN